MQTVSFVHMADGTREDYDLIKTYTRHMDDHLVDQIISMLEGLKGSTLGYKVDRYTHSLQSATLALRDGADEELVVCALLHDVGDNLAPHNHSQLAAALLRPYVSEENHWIVAHHGLFQGYYYYHHRDKDRNARDVFRDHPYYDACARFCERYDQCAFDPDYDTLELDTFEPMMRRLFASPKQGFD